MKRIYHNHEKWECVKAGLYLQKIPYEDSLVKESRKLLTNLNELEAYMWEVCKFWPISCEQNMTNPSRNLQAYLGQAACCYHHNAPEYVTKQAWKMLTDNQREKANAVADKIIQKYFFYKQNGKNFFE